MSSIQTKTSLSNTIIETLTVISRIEEKISNKEPFPEELIHLDVAVANFEQSIDKRIALVDRLNIEIKAIDEEIDFLKGRKTVFENILQRIKDYMQYLMEQHPEVEFKGSTKKFALQNNGGKQKLNWNIKFEPIEIKLVKEEDRAQFPAAYVSERSYLVFDAEKFAEDLRSGKIPEDVSKVAELEPRGKHVRIR